MGKNWVPRGDNAEMGGNGGRPDKGTGASPRGRDYHPGRSCQYEAAKVVTVAAIAVRVAALTWRAYRAASAQRG